MAIMHSPTAQVRSPVAKHGSLQPLREVETNRLASDVERHCLVKCDGSSFGAGSLWPSCVSAACFTPSPAMECLVKAEDLQTRTSNVLQTGWGRGRPCVIKRLDLKPYLRALSLMLMNVIRAVFSIAGTCSVVCTPSSPARYSLYYSYFRYINLSRWTGYCRVENRHAFR